MLERYPKPVTKKTTQKILEQMNNSFFIINEKDNSYGLFCKIMNKNKNIPVIIINNFKGKINNSINILTNNNKHKKIKLANIIYENKEFNILIIKIEDNFDKNIKFIEIDDKLYENDYEINFS